MRYSKVPVLAQETQMLSTLEDSQQSQMVQQSLMALETLLQVQLKLMLQVMRLKTHTMWMLAKLPCTRCQDTSAHVQYACMQSSLWSSRSAALTPTANRCVRTRRACIAGAMCAVTSILSITGLTSGIAVRLAMNYLAAIQARAAGCFSL